MLRALKNDRAHGAVAMERKHFVSINLIEQVSDTVTGPQKFLRVKHFESFHFTMHWSVTDS